MTNSKTSGGIPPEYCNNLDGDKSWISYPETEEDFDIRTVGCISVDNTFKPDSHVLSCLKELPVSMNHVEKVLAEHYPDIDLKHIEKYVNLSYYSNMSMSSVCDFLHIEGLSSLMSEAERQCLLTFAISETKFCYQEMLGEIRIGSGYHLFVLAKEEGKTTVAFLKLSLLNISQLLPSGSKSRDKSDYFAKLKNILRYLAVMVLELKGVIPENLLKDTRSLKAIMGVAAIPGKKPIIRSNMPKYITMGTPSSHSDILILGSESLMKDELQMCGLTASIVDSSTEFSIMKTIPMARINAYLAKLARVYMLDEAGQGQLARLSEATVPTVLHESYNADNPMRGYQLVALDKHPSRDTFSCVVFKFEDKGSSSFFAECAARSNIRLNWQAIRNIFRYLTLKRMVQEGVISEGDIRYINV